MKRPLILVAIIAVIIAAVRCMFFTDASAAFKFIEHNNSLNVLTYGEIYKKTDYEAITSVYLKNCKITYDGVDYSSGNISATLKKDMAADLRIGDIIQGESVVIPMKRFYCVILAMLAVVLYAIVMSGCRAISSNVEVATQPVVETPLAEHIGKVRQGPFVNDAEEFVRNISVLLEEKSPHDYSVRRIEEILLNNGYLEEYFKGNTEPLALYCFEYIINHESLCYVSDNQNVSFSGNDKAIALIAWELMLTYDDTDLNYITSASSLENWLYFLRTGAPVNFILAESNIDDTYYTTHPIEKQYIVAMLRDPKRIFFLTVNYLSDPELIQETNLAFYRLFSSGIMNMQMTIIPENTTIEDLRANCTEFSYWVINEKNDDIILEITSDTGNLIQVIIENAS